MLSVVDLFYQVEYISHNLVEMILVKEISCSLLIVTDGFELLSKDSDVQLDLLLILLQKLDLDEEEKYDLLRTTNIP